MVVIFYLFHKIDNSISIIESHSNHELEADRIPISNQ